MEARDLLRAGDLAGALEALKQEIRSAPRDPKLRTFLFQLACILGDWERADTQLGVVAELDGLAIPMAQTYRAVIRCEMLRERVFAGRATPTVFGEPQNWMSLLIEANRRLGAGDGETAAKLRDAAFEEAPETPGVLDGTGFAWIADADSRLGPMLETFVDGKYYWVPFLRIAAIRIDPPEDLRDQVWLPAHFTWTNGGEANGFIPSRYPGSAAAEDPAIALSRRTEWIEIPGGAKGLGQRMLTTDAAEAALLDVRGMALHQATADSTRLSRD
jgi:type VI secretion system protein ImpE